MRNEMAEKIMYTKGLNNKFIVEVKTNDGVIKIMRLEWASYMFNKEFMDVISDYKENEWVEIPEEYVDNKLTQIRPIKIYRVSEEHEYIIRLLSSLFSQYTPVMVKDIIPKDEEYNCIIQDKLYYTKYKSTDRVTAIIIRKDLTLVEFSNVLPAVVDLAIKYNNLKQKLMDKREELLKGTKITK